MKQQQSVLWNGYLVLLASTLFASYFSKFLPVFVLVSCLLLLFPSLVILQQKKLLTFSLLSVGIFFCLLAITVGTFRIMRSFFPIPVISEQKVIGFAQYNGYPLVFDTVLFFVLIGFLISALFAAHFILKRITKL